MKNMKEEIEDQLMNKVAVEFKQTKLKQERELQSISIEK